MFEIVAGLRFDSFKLKVDDLRPHINAEFHRTDNLWSPRLGLIFKPRENLSFYASYSRSYLPQSGDQFSGLDLSTEALKPERFDNYEFGAKWEPVDGLLATAAVYLLDRTNTRAPNPDGSGTVVLTGEQRSKGIELGLERQLAGVGRLRLAEGRDPRTNQRLQPGRGQLRSPAGTPAQLLVVDPLQCFEAIRVRRRRDRPVEEFCFDWQHGEAARLCPVRRGAVLHHR
jgi:outer membrane receptor protein involved in Fe transport